MTKVSTKGIATGFAPIAAGVYKGVLSKYSEQLSKQAGKGDVPKDAKSFCAEFTITSGGEDDTVGTKQFLWGSLQSHALFGIKRVGVAVGVPDDVLEDDDGWDPLEILPEYYATEVDLIVTMGEYQGRATNNVDVILEGEQAAAPGGGWS